MAVNGGRGKKGSPENSVALNIIPTIDVVVFPQMVVPLLVMDSKIISGVVEANQKGENILLVAARVGANYVSGPVAVEDLFKVGTVAKIIRVMSLADGSIKILVQGVYRADVFSISVRGQALKATVAKREFSNSADKKNEIESKMREIAALIEKLAQHMGQYGREFQILASQIHDPERLVDFLLSQINLAVEHCQSLLEKSSVLELLDQLQKILSIELESESFADTANDSENGFDNIFSRSEIFGRNKENCNTEQSPEDTELDSIRRKIQTLPLSKEASEEAERQLRRLERTSSDSLESSVIRNHLDWLLGMPWGIFTKDSYDISKALAVLEEDHFGMDIAKDRMLDYLSVRTFQSKQNTPILCFYGPPGVGKTSLAQSIAKAMNRKFQRIAVGGVSDESEIRGHRRTYVGALPGRIIQAVKKAGSMNPVLLIDEIDKLGVSGKGDPSAAMLEVCDPEQNHSFYDNYLGVPFDLSSVMFIATANDVSAIPAALRDRMEIIELTGYATDEKLSICKNYLIKKVLKNFGLEDKGFNLSDGIIRDIINSYTRESGVRELERLVQKLCSKFARQLLEKNAGPDFCSETICNYLGQRRYQNDNFDKNNKIGVANGLAWTAHGGELLQVESLLVPGNGKITLTGQLGDVMKESAQAAISYAKSNADRFNISEKLFSKYDLHIHLPAGAIPKDGPSAGITLLSSVLSAYTRRAVDCRYAMTGELNLQGNVLPIGGVKEKMLAAKRYGVDCVILPEKNRPDVAESKIDMTGLDLFFASSVFEILQKVLLPA